MSYLETNKRSLFFTQQLKEQKVAGNRTNEVRDCEEELGDILVLLLEFVDVFLTECCGGFVSSCV